MRLERPDDKDLASGRNKSNGINASPVVLLVILATDTGHIPVKVVLKSLEPNLTAK